MPFNCNKKPNLFKCYKQTKSFATRREEVAAIKSKYPNRIPIIVEKYSHESSLPNLDKIKFLVPEMLPMARFLVILREKMHLSPSQSLYLIVNNKSMVCSTKLLAEVYKENKDEDGFLYITYASQEMFG